MAIGVVVALASATACNSDPPAEVRTIDLIRSFDDADRRPSDGTFGLVEHTCGGLARASISTPVPSRLTWVTTIPERAILKVDVTVPGSDGPPAVVNVRVGISDDRVYESLTERRITSPGAACGWTTIVADLSPYAGKKFSIFYQPDGRRWHLVLGADPVEGHVPAVYWGSPGIDTDAPAARAFVRRRAER